MRIWIDATQPESRLEIFSMSLLERQLRPFALADKKISALKSGVHQAGLAAAREQFVRLARSHSCASEIWIELPEGDPTPDWIPESLLERLPIHWKSEPGSARERLQRALRDADGETVIAISGDTVIDERIVEQITWWEDGSVAFISDEGERSAAVIRFEQALPDGGGDEDGLVEIARNAISGGFVKSMVPEDVDAYIKKLRRHLPPFAIRVTDEETRATTERYLFDSNYKGSTDFMTKWVYPPLVWRMLHPLAKLRISPNYVTCVGIVCCFGSVPLFASGMWLSGLILAYVMTILDSVDGKLARVTFQSSAQGDVLDHGTDIVHPPFWYWAWGWGLSGGDPYSGVVQASMWMVAFYMFDRIMEVLFTASTGKSIHGYTEFDNWIRTYISRRNVNLALFTVGLLLGLGTQTFYLIVAWQGLCALYHFARVVQFWNDADNEMMYKGTA
jgi:phosphatidylglycerophosphate synthase